GPARRRPAGAPAGGAGDPPVLGSRYRVPGGGGRGGGASGGSAPRSAAGPVGMSPAPEGPGPDRPPTPTPAEAGPAGAHPPPNPWARITAIMATLATRTTDYHPGSPPGAGPRYHRVIYLAAPPARGVTDRAAASLPPPVAARVTVRGLPPGAAL